jgi:hypothetical protein
LKNYKFFLSPLSTLIITVATLARLVFFWNIVFLPPKIGNLGYVAGKKKYRFGAHVYCCSLVYFQYLVAVSASN